MRTISRNDWRADLLEFLPGRVAAAVKGLPDAIVQNITELRFGLLRPMLAVECSGDHFVRPDGALSAQPAGALVADAEECRQFLDSVTKFSAYAYADELRNGFLTLKGGYRVGIAGKVVVRCGSVDGFNACTSFCVRIPREFTGIANELYSRIRTATGLMNTLIVSPPGMGKTTYLRDLSRLISTGYGGHRGLRTCVIDERSEIAGGLGSLRFDLGQKTDVMDGCPKSQGINLALRSLNPQAIVTDEIGRPEDAVALLDAINCGVTLIASAHGGSIAELLHRPVMREIMEGNYFDLYVIIDGSKGVGVVTSLVYGMGGEAGGRLAGGAK